jgi:hypothetical protein
MTGTLLAEDQNLTLTLADPVAAPGAVSAAASAAAERGSVMIGMLLAKGQDLALADPVAAPADGSAAVEWGSWS